MFQEALCTGARQTRTALLQKFPQSATDCLLYGRKGVLGRFIWQWQNDRDYAPRDKETLHCRWALAVLLPDVQQVADFIEENSCAFKCLNISNILLTHNTLCIQSYKRTRIKISALKMQFVCTFFHKLSLFCLWRWCIVAKRFDGSSW